MQKTVALLRATVFADRHNLNFTVYGYLNTAPKIGASSDAINFDKAIISFLVCSALSEDTFCRMARLIRKSLLPLSITILGSMPTRIASAANWTIGSSCRAVKKFRQPLH